jgi:hypothetical protein
MSNSLGSWWNTADTQGLCLTVGNAVGKGGCLGER